MDFLGPGFGHGDDLLLAKASNNKGMVLGEGGRSCGRLPVAFREGLSGLQGPSGGDRCKV